jgi:hypothetical protein
MDPLRAAAELSAAVAQRSGEGAIIVIVETFGAIVGVITVSSTVSQQLSILGAVAGAVTVNLERSQHSGS